MEEKLQSHAEGERYKGNNPTEKARKRTAKDAFLGGTDPNIWDAALSVRGEREMNPMRDNGLAQRSQSEIKDRKAKTSAE